MVLLIFKDEKNREICGEKTFVAFSNPKISAVIIQ